MKKLFTYLSVAMLAVAAVSCQKEMVVEEGNGNVTFTIQTPEVATKAIADGMNVNIVHYEIYKNEAGHKNSIDGGTPLIKGTTKMTAKGASLTLNLLQGQSYVGLFWAQVDGKPFYNTDDLRNVTVNYAGSANNENRAAFCQSKVFSTGGTVSVTLERPFAQINLGTTLSSIDSAVNGYDIALESSAMEIVGVATSFSVAEMKTGTTTTNVAYEANTVPHNMGEELTVNNVKYAYLGMNYILAAGNQATVDVKYTVSTDVGSITRTVPTVPVQKNHRTNLLGNLLTQETAIEIVVDERFAEPDLEPEAIHMAAAMGGEFTLTEDLELEAPVVVPANTNFVLNLNGKTIKNKTQSEEFGEGEGIIAYGNLTINGEGTVEASTMAVWARGADGANVTINGGTYKGCAEGFAKGGRSVIYASSGNTINIYGGTFESLAADKTSYADKTNGVYAALNVADNNGNINVYGGTFVKQNPAAPGTEPATWNAAHPNGFVAEGYDVIADGDVYYVVEDDTDAVITTAAELADVINGATADISVKFVSDLTGIIRLNQNSDVKVTIDGNGKKFTGGIHIYGNGGKGNRGMIIKNINFDGTGLNADEVNNGDQGCIYTTGGIPSGNSYVYNVTIENCSFTGDGIAAIRQNVGGDENWTIKNCTVSSDMHSFLQIANTGKSLKIENCKVYSKNGANLNNTATASFTGCEFDVQGYAVRVGVTGSNSTETKVFNFTDCTLKSANDDGDAVVIIRQNAQQATLNFVNTTLVGTPQISGNVEGKTTINGL